MGLCGVVAGGRAIYVWAVAFVAMMLAGFAAATFGLQMPFVEPAVSPAVVIFALLVALAVKATVSLGAAIAGSSRFFMATPVASRP